MKKRKQSFLANELLTAIALILIGLMFMIYKGEIISIAMSVIGALLLVLGVLDVINGRTVGGAVKIGFGALVLVAGWVFLKLALYILGAFLLVAGISELSVYMKIKPKKMTLGYITHILQPIVYILVAICLFFNQGGAISSVFTVSGLFLVLDRVIGLVGALDQR
jgi:uncharacterized membrane protein HdeD (DUF308 family)